MSAFTLFTIGHSTRSLGELTRMLSENLITLLVDVRTVPRSRHNPQFDRETLPEVLESAGIGYLHMKELGGLRHPVKDSSNSGWRTPGFRGYADFMLTGEFAAALDLLIDLARRQRLAIMCAEAVPWRCHRSLISDALLTRGIAVKHLLSPGHGQPHRLTPFAHVEGTRVTYPGSD